MLGWILAARSVRRVLACIWRCNLGNDPFGTSVTAAPSDLRILAGRIIGPSDVDLPGRMRGPDRSETTQPELAPSHEAALSVCSLKFLYPQFKATFLVIVLCLAVLAQMILNCPSFTMVISPQTVALI